MVASDGSEGHHVDAVVNGASVLSTNWTFAAWIHPTAAGGRGPGEKPVAVVTAQANPDTPTESVEILLSNVSGTQRLELTRGSTYIGEPSTLPVPLNAWTHIAVTVSSTRQVKYYVNGVLAGDFPTQYTARNVALGGSSGSGAGALRLMGNSADRQFAGRLDEVQVFKTALSATEIQDIRWGKPPSPSASNLAAWFRFQEGAGSLAATSDTSPAGQPAATLAPGVTWELVPVATFVVNTAADEDDIPIGASTSLREALREAVAGYGPAAISFAPTLAGTPLTISSGLSVPGGGALLIDASDLDGGITLLGAPGLGESILSMGVPATTVVRKVSFTQGASGAVANQGELELVDCRFSSNSSFFGGIVVTSGPTTVVGCEWSNNSGTAFSNAGATATLTRCSILNGSSFFGGSVTNQGTLTIDESILAGNSAQTGAAVFNQGTLTVRRSTFENNNASLAGGAISNQGSATIYESLFAGNGANDSGGAINSQGDLTLINSTLHNNTGDPGAIIATGNTFIISHCTITGNSSGIWDRLTRLQISNSVVAENTQYDIIDALPGTNNHIGGNPLLGPLNHYGGPTRTRVPLAGSPLLDAAAPAPGITTDQRGYPRNLDGQGDGIAQPDIGAYEAGTLQKNYNAYAWETIPPTATPAERAPTFDFDGDGRSNEEEWHALTRAADGSSLFQPASEWTGPDLVISFPSHLGRQYQLFENLDLNPEGWTAVAGSPVIPGTGNTESFTVPAAAMERRFYQVVATPP